MAKSIETVSRDNATGRLRSISSASALRWASFDLRCHLLGHFALQPCKLVRATAASRPGCVETKLDTRTQRAEVRDGRLRVFKLSAEPSCPPLCQGRERGTKLKNERQRIAPPSMLPDGVRTRSKYFLLATGISETKTRVVKGTRRYS